MEEFEEDVDFTPGQTLVEVFGEKARLLNDKGRDVRNPTVPQSLKTKRVLVVDGVAFSIAYKM